MKDFISRPANFTRIEFWGASAIYIFAVFFLISHSLNLTSVTNDGMAQVRTPFDYFFVSKLIRYTALYLSFLFLNFRVMPELIKKESVALNIALTVVLFILMGLVFGATATFLKYYMISGFRTDRSTHNFHFQNGFLYAAWLLLLYGFYTVIKYTGIYLLSRSEALQSKYKIVTPGSLVAIVIWMILLFFMIVGGAPKPAIGFFVTLVPHAILLYGYSFYTLIPKSLPKKRPFIKYLLKVVLILILTAIPVALLTALVTTEEDAVAIITFFNVAFQLVITAPFTWVIFKRYLQGRQEILFLKTELGRSNASFDFLRSQINPHFLFNALNTIYGTALQEGAERTGEGIEKLGSMMRFMLQENMQDKISLAREIEYLNNYISLQKLRTDANPNINIDVYIEQPLHSPLIAPMLLIPFVENAFKHGISFREPSHIKVSLELKDKTLLFDVSNSKHAQNGNDPEKEKSGIGLNNVKQRLSLIYNGSHDLMIRETARDFFVHLTIKLP